jgi:AraC-like DNA-binding protein
MNPDFTDFVPVRLSTDAFPHDRRLQMWRDIYDRTCADFYGRTVGHLDIEPINDQPFRAGVTLRSLPGLGIAHGYRSDAHYHRTREVAALSSDNLILAAGLNGVIRFCQRGREATLGAGEAVLLSATEASTNTLRSGGRLMMLSVPRAVVSTMVVDAGSMLLRPIPRHGEALKLLLAYLGTLDKMTELRDAALQRAVVNHVYDLLAAALGAAPDAMRAARAGGIRAARLATIRADVLANLSDVGLSAKTISRRHGVTDRYVHLLFAETGQSFGRFVEEERLKRAFALLTHPTRAVRKIGEVAGAVGFPEHSTFNRAFRRRFGDTPSGVRRNGIDEQPAPDERRADVASQSRPFRPG